MEILDTQNHVVITTNTPLVPAKQLPPIPPGWNPIVAQAVVYNGAKPYMPYQNPYLKGIMNMPSYPM